MTELSITSFDPDTVSRRALGALHFIDACTGETVTDGLMVLARIRNKSIQAIPSLRGVYVFHQLPGLLEVSYWDGETTPVPSPQKYVYRIEVRDTLQRFCPVAFDTNLADWPEVVTICTGAAFTGKEIQLYSMPWRMQRNDYAIVRGTLQVFSTKKPASWALLRAFRNADDETTAKPVCEGVAGKNGEFMLMFPLPIPDPAVLNSPTAPVWTVKFIAWYDPPDASIPEAELPDGEKRLPELCSILGQQKAKLKATTNATTELSPKNIVPGQTLVLTTDVIPPVTPSQQILYLETT